MALKDLTASSVEEAVKQFNRLGREAFLKAHKFSKARTYFLEIDGKLYDSKAIAGVAHAYVKPGFTHLKSSQFSGGEGTVKQVLEGLGFKVVKQGSSPPTKPPSELDWTRDELILVLDIYLQSGKPATSDGEAAVELSNVLARLNEALGRNVDPALRSPDAVYQTFGAFEGLDPNQAKQDDPPADARQRALWEEFNSDPDLLHQIAETIRQVIDQPDGGALSDYDPDEITEAAEGKIFTRLHRYRERNRKLVERRKDRVLKKTGKLACEACGFDFATTYGKRGQRYIEAHHTKPVSTLAEDSKTKAEDLALLCANCHRMVHSAQPWLSVEELRGVIESAKA
jgi:5-methylcytosine-specific restriction protein A